MTAEQAERLITTVEQLVRRFDEFARVYLDAKFPHGRALDRWGRRV